MTQDIYAISNTNISYPHILMSPERHISFSLSTLWTLNWSNTNILYHLIFYYYFNIYLRERKMEERESGYDWLPKPSPIPAGPYPPTPYHRALEPALAAP